MLSHLEGALYIARSSYVAPVAPAPLPPPLLAAIDNPLRECAAARSASWLRSRARRSGHGRSRAGGAGAACRRRQPAGRRRRRGGTGRRGVPASPPLAAAAAVEPVARRPRGCRPRAPRHRQARRRSRPPRALRSRRPRASRSRRPRASRTRRQARRCSRLNPRSKHLRHGLPAARSRLPRSP